MDVRILKYNNYYNRIVKYEANVDNYMKYVIASIFNANFKPNDNVNTQFVFNYDSALQNKGGDYVLVTNDDATEVSRWFIMESVRLLNGQYRLTLRRDLIVDNLEILLDAPCFIEKATLDNSNPLIFNNENMSFNQIKTSETLLKDKTGCAWIVGYAAKGSTTEQLSWTDRNPQSDYTLDEFKAVWNKYAGTDNRVRYINEQSIKYRWITTDATYITGYDTNVTPNEEPYITKLESFEAGTPLVESDLIASLKLQKENIRNTIQWWDEKYVKDGDNVVQILITPYLENGNFNKWEDAVGSVKLSMDNRATVAGYNEEQVTSEQYNRKGYGYQYGVSAPVDTINYQITIAEHYDLKDAPYGIFAIPYGAYKAKCGTNTIEVTDLNSKTMALSVARELSEQWGGASAKLYDIQLLPYCPLQEFINESGEIIVSDEKNYSLIKSGEAVKGCMLWANTSTMRFTIPYTITVTDPKITNECDMWRLSSPNYNGQFEFNAAKNGGVSYFNVDCEYKPYSPHIHIAPNFNLLYGQDFDDGRGLICAGDFSLTQTSDAFATYQRQNANYDNIFNRQIQNMEFNNKQALAKDIISGITGVASAGVTTGSVFGGAAGAAGAVLSGIGAAADIGMNIGARREALDYTKDLHGYQLGNIKALPNSITKISSLSPDFKLFPILEYYTCTEVEKQALRDKLKYNGMTVMTIGTIRQYLRSEKSYIKGQLIRLEGLDEDTNYINNISQEIYKGVFI